jgi:hypothetical protein
MKACISGLFALVLLAAAGPAYAQIQPEAPADQSKPAEPVSVPQPELDPCEVPGYILFGESKLDHVKKVVEEHKRLNVLVIGSGSSVMPGPDGAGKAYPGRLEQALRKRFPGIEIKVTALAKSRQTAADMSQALEKALLDQKPDLVIWTRRVFAFRSTKASTISWMPAPTWS